MIASLGTLFSRATLALRLAAFAGVFIAGPASVANAQVVNPGDIIVERQITPRVAYAPVPRDDDPVTSRVSTFPASTFNPTVAQVRRTPT